MSAPPTFDEFVAAVHGREAFPWQRVMADMLVTGTPPDLITVPTGLGKTSVLDAWTWALAMQADRGVDRRVTTRAAFVVDRRVIVDAAFEHASVIQRALCEPAHPATEWAAERLLGLGHELERAIEVVRMRGGVTWSWRWLRQPDQPAVIVGTVDQFGSRFLFRGYGVGDRLRPIDAALVGTDVTAFVDEAHLSTSLGHTVRTCRELEARAVDAPLGRATTLVAMSATPPIGVPDNAMVLTVGPDDFDHPVAAQRLAAVKSAELVDLPASTKAAAVDSLAKELATRARALAADGQVVAVVVNTIDTARRVYELVSAVTKKEPPVDAVLAIGRCRNLDRDASRRLWWDRAAAGRTRTTDADGLVIVATQTIEVGADLDVDTLLTEIAPIDALVQRFGRVDRLGSLGSTASWIVRQPTRSAGPVNWVYGETADRTWQWLETQGGFGSVDFGSEAMGARLRGLSDAERRDLVAPIAPIPELFDEVLHQLARTNPAPNPDHPIATYLHGMQEAQPTVSVIWRAGIAQGDVPEMLAAAPPTTAEAVDVPLVHAARFLRGEPFGATASDLDIVVAPEDDSESKSKGGQAAPPLLDAWRVQEGVPHKIENRRELRPGDLIVVDADVGGHDQFGWTGHSDGRTVADIADLVRVGPAQLRLDQRVLSSILGPLDVVVNAADAEINGVADCCDRLERASLAELSGGDPDDDLDARVAALLSAIRRAAQGRPLAAEMERLLDQFEGGPWNVVTADRESRVSRSSARVLVEGFSTDDEGTVTCSGLRLVAASTRVSLDRADDTELGSSLIGGEVSLDTHLGAVGGRAAAYAAKVGVADTLVETLRVAGLAHDLGKLDARFQTLLRGGDWLAAAAFETDPSRALAKSVPGSPLSRVEEDSEWRWPRGMRHEAVSVALLRGANLPADLDHELIEHLVAAHHGWSRPLFPPVLDDRPRIVAASFQGETLRASSDDVLVDWSQPARFRRLCERYGWWGLALLETLLRLADIAVSEEGS